MTVVQSIIAPHFRLGGMKSGSTLLGKIHAIVMTVYSTYAQNVRGLILGSSQMSQWDRKMSEKKTKENMKQHFQSHIPRPATMIEGR